MSNHYHLLLETPEANLVAGMKWLQATYTQRYNRRHKLHGHLFQGRYKAVVVDGAEEPYFQVVSTYIHLNPVRANLIRFGQGVIEGLCLEFGASLGSSRFHRPEIEGFAQRRA
jgi:putative transposase